MIYDITSFGAVAGLEALQTAAIQSAIDACAAAGGGTVLVPPGVYRTGTIRLRSNITLKLENGAVLRGPDSIDDYLKYPFAWELYAYTVSLIYAVDEHNIRICGEGVIDFNGIAFANTDKLCIDENMPQALHVDAHYEMPPRDRRPNRLVFFLACEDVEISGVMFADSPTWTLVFHRCTFLRLHDFHVKNNLRIPNSDGIHCCGCKDVIVSGCFFNCGDDCIAITSISDESAVSERIVIADCIFQSVSAALRIGFQAGKVRDVWVRNCIIRESNRGIAIFAGAGGFVENVSIDGILIDCRMYAGYWWGKGEPMVVCSSDAGAPICNISLRNAVIRAENGIIVSAVNGSISKLRLENLNMQIAYGSRRPWCGGKIDLAPNPGKDAPDAQRSIPWLWSEGGAEIDFTHISAQHKAGETVAFDTKELIQK